MDAGRCRHVATLGVYKCKTRVGEDVGTLGVYKCKTRVGEGAGMSALNIKYRYADLL